MLFFLSVFDLVAVFESSQNRPVEYNSTEAQNSNSSSPIPFRRDSTASRYLLLGSFPYYFSLIFTVKTQLADDGFVLDFRSEIGNETEVLLSVAAQNRTLNLDTNKGHVGDIRLTAEIGRWVKFGIAVDDGFLAVIQNCKESLKLPLPRDLALWKRRGRIELTIQDELDSTKQNVRIVDCCKINVLFTIIK